MYKISVVVFLCLCCFITTKPLHRNGHTNMSHTLVSGNQSARFVDDYDLGLSDQSKDSISAGRGIRLFQYPPMQNEQTAKREDTTTKPKKAQTKRLTRSTATPPSTAATKNFVQLWGLSVEDEKLKPRARDVVDAQAEERPAGDGLEAEQEESDEDNEEAADRDEDAPREEALTEDVKLVPRITAAEPELRPEKETQREDDVERDDTEEDDNVIGGLDKSGNEDAARDDADVLGFKSLMTPKSLVGEEVQARQEDEVTYANNWQDTRREEWRSALARAGIMSNPLSDYYPSNTKNLSTVCILKSSIVNFPKVFKWLHKMILNITYHQRPVFTELRRELYDFGKSEMCHTTDMTDWEKYQLCALMRNQRMEYMIPHYPLHQVGYRLLFKAKRD
ncbi:nucleolin-like [Drosophila subobscura]|uniref:nucleolin-like n=1 Tax=Drosophila subobscura TaxID=7241 RepID=UPI00155B0446|nr:nucleolin-like [Drosophila subobscura]